LTQSVEKKEKTNDFPSACHFCLECLKNVYYLEAIYTESDISGIFVIFKVSSARLLQRHRSNLKKSNFENDHRTTISTIDYIELSTGIDKFTLKVRLCFRNRNTSWEVTAVEE